MSQNQKNKKQKKIAQQTANVLESLKDLGASSARGVKQELTKETPKEFVNQLFGVKTPDSNGEIRPGETLEINAINKTEYTEQIKLQRQVAFERRLREEERVHIERKTNELKIQLQTIQQEILTITQKTQNLAEETRIATMQATVEPGTYHVIFFEKLLKFLKDFGERIDEASTWLHSLNKRAKKKGWVANFKKHGAKYLLSGEHYSARSAG